MLQQPASVLLQCPSLMFYPDSPIQSMHIPTFVGRISALMSRDDSCTFPLRNPCLDQAFPVIEATCCLNIRSSSTSTPKNFFCFVHGMMVNGCSDGVHFLENRICLHFVALNNMSHFCSHCSSMVKSSWRASMFAELLYRMVSTCTLVAPTLLSLNKNCPFPNFYCPFCQSHSNTLLKGMGMTGAGKASMFLCKHSASWSFNFF